MSAEIIAAIVLAAGSSSRMGKPKQLLRYRGETLIHRAAENALNAGCNPVMVVSGRDHEKIEAELAALKVHLVYNENWEQGIGSSIKAGIKDLLNVSPAAEAVIITVCDQLFVSPEILSALIKKREETRKKVIASVYSHSLGVPALFDRQLFSQLEQLGDQEGARQIFRSVEEEMEGVPFPKGGVDIDTPYDCLVHLS